MKEKHICKTKSEKYYAVIVITLNYNVVLTCIWYLAFGLENSTLTVTIQTEL